MAYFLYKRLKIPTAIQTRLFFIVQVPPKCFYTSMAEQERAIILQRQREGIAVAKAKGKHLGRPIIAFPKEWDRLYKEWKSGTITAVAFMKEIGMKKATFYNKVRAYEERK
ncbi:hypothetical protein [Priestia megaterium]|uniref:hypothetical protein n=1 Tax=Priestia megaterium TaxID=1404 RepID=UPI0034586A35